MDVDPVTAAVAQANLAGRAEVICADADQVAEQLITPGVGVFCDPARRRRSGRLWRVEDFSRAGRRCCSCSMAREPPVPNSARRYRTRSSPRQSRPSG